jgi:ABC-type thiamine transport system substrate-binding protein
MNSKWILLLPVILLGLSGCWLDEAAEPQKKSLNIVADRLSHEDSTIIEQFGKKYHVTIQLELLKAEALLKRIRADRYNANIDILITEDQSLRSQLQELNAFRAIRNTAPFGQLERQFNNQHHYWIPVSHDPLIVTRAKDSTGCTPIDFRKWHKTDSLKPAFLVARQRNNYLSLLRASTRLSSLLSDSRKPVGEHIYTLSEFVGLENTSDSLYHSKAHACRFFLIDNQRYVSTVNTAGIYRHGRNSSVAEHFLTFFVGHSYSIASGRNQLPTRKNVTANWFIRSLSIQ